MYIFWCCGRGCVTKHDKNRRANGSGHGVSTACGELGYLVGDSRTATAGKKATESRKRQAKTENAEQRDEGYRHNRRKRGSEMQHNFDGTNGAGIVISMS